MEFRFSHPARDPARAMSQENVERTRLGYEAFNRGDFDAALDLCAPDIEWQDMAIDTPPIRGKHALRALFESVMQAPGGGFAAIPRKSSTSATTRCWSCFTPPHVAREAASRSKPEAQVC